MNAESHVKYEVHRQCELSPEEVTRYWSHIYECDLLSRRICHIINPTVEDALHLVQQYPYQFYYVKSGGEMVAEFMLEGFTGEAAQIHFSMNPQNPFIFSLQLAREVSNDVLTKWQKKGNKQPFLRSLYGMTPSSNRPALLFIRRAGFLRKAVLPYGIYDRGELADAVLTVKTREGVMYGWQ